MFNFLKPSVSDLNAVSREVQKINSLESEIQTLSDAREGAKVN